MKSPPARRYLTPTEVAEMLHVSPITVRQWAQKGELPAELTPGGHRRFNLDAVETFAHERKLTLESRRRGPHKILIVDDDVAFAGYLTAQMERLPNPPAVAIAHDGFQAGRLLHTFRPELVLLDLRMPGLDGVQVCQQIKSDPQSSSVRVIAMTGYADDERIRSVLSAGAERCLAKPFHTQELIDTLKLTD